MVSPLPDHSKTAGLATLQLIVGRSEALECLSEKNAMIWLELGAQVLRKQDQPGRLIQGHSVALALLSDAFEITFGALMHGCL